MGKARPAALLAMSLAGLQPVGAGQDFAGPVAARVVEVLDGDTFVADAHVWPGQTVRVNIRIRGIDAPEMKSRCVREHSAAIEAREALAGLLEDGEVSISNIGGAKYYGRVLADVSTRDGSAVGEILLDLETGAALLGWPACRLVQIEHDPEGPRYGCTQP
ncbi:thermonuclease family protein [Pseudaminobacter salicylatoxidans]|uniref:thermonuclease family protein n=1 Tax=Pseudaminobacter salicylatoxidans TaxID=93369 RepID=UPI001FCA5174|nr:thermonuclease family protein [Pseudaminobacter salicylatoxidans]